MSEKPTHTAYENIPYNLCIKGKTYEEWAYGIHKALADAHGWVNGGFVPEPGSYYFDSFIVSTNYVLIMDPIPLELEDMAFTIHCGAEFNYLYWKIKKPYDVPNSHYIKPFNALDDDKRIAKYRHYETISDFEKQRCRIIANYILSELQKESNPNLEV